MSGSSEDLNKKIRCSICLNKIAVMDMQTLNCKHSFCGTCLSFCVGHMCPAVNCEETRSTDIFVDEMAGGSDGQRISFGSQSLSMLDLEDRQKCNARRVTLPCTNVARIILANCRHNVCYDCISVKIHQSHAGKSSPTCPIQYCANRLSRMDVLQVAQKFPLIAPIVAQIDGLLADNRPTAVAGKEEMLISCAAYGKENKKKRIIVPNFCQAVDLLSACLQIHNLKKRTIKNTGIYIRQEVTKETTKYERILVKELGKATVKDAGWPEKLELIIDVDNQLTKTRKETSKKKNNSIYLLK